MLQCCLNQPRLACYCYFLSQKRICWWLLNLASQRKTASKLVPVADKRNLCHLAFCLSMEPSVAWLFGQDVFEEPVESSKGSRCEVAEGDPPSFSLTGVAGVSDRVPSFSGKESTMLRAGRCENCKLDCREPLQIAGTCFSLRICN